MKALVCFSVSLLLAIMVSCDTTQNAAGSQPEELSDYFRQVPGLSVIGKGEYAIVRVRGIADYQGSGEPLFIINGREYLGGFQSIYYEVAPEEIRSVRVLRHSSELFKYGSLGVNGAVEINTIL
jgi:hypothetical protein